MRADAERSVPVEPALARAEAECERLGVRPHYRWKGGADRPIVAVALADAGGAVVAESAGKGAGRQCLASGLFEALEHYHQEQGLRRIAADPDRATVLSAVAVASQPELRDDALVHRLAAEFPDAAVGCLRFEPVRPGGAGLWYPAFVKNPHCRRYPIPGESREHAAYHRYSSGNGTASGAERVDASVHGLLELLERDAVSLAYIDWFLRRTGPLRRIDPDRLPADVRGLWELAGRTVGSPPLLLDLTTDLGVPVVLALPSEPGSAVVIPGAGASLHAAYAVERALDELLQICAADDAAAMAENRMRGRQLAQWPALRAAYDLDPVRLLALGTVEAELVATVPPPEPAAQLALLADRLESRGYRAFRTSWTPPESLVAVECLLVPGLESFFMVQLGVPILPTGRGAAVGAGRG